MPTPCWLLADWCPEQEWPHSPLGPPGHPVPHRPPCPLLQAWIQSSHWGAIPCQSRARAKDPTQPSPGHAQGSDLLGTLVQCPQLCATKPHRLGAPGEGRAEPGCVGALSCSAPCGGEGQKRAFPSTCRSSWGSRRGQGAARSAQDEPKMGPPEPPRPLCPQSSLGTAWAGPCRWKALSQELPDGESCFPGVALEGMQIL